MNTQLVVGYLLAIVLGSIAGSFLNVIVYRLPSIAIAGIRPGATYGVSYLAWPLSFCPHCGMGIKPWHNIPIFTWLLLRGRSKCCNKLISPRYLVLEVLGSLLAVACFYRFGWHWVTFFATVYCCLLLALAWIDAERYVLPDLLVQPLLWLGLTCNMVFGFVPLENALIGTIAGWLFLALIGESTVWFAHKRMLGAGDPKLFAAIGAWLGWHALPGVLIIGAASASVYGISRQLLRGRIDTKAMVPFGPHLALGGMLLLFFGYKLIPLYLLR